MVFYRNIGIGTRHECKIMYIDISGGGVNLDLSLNTAMDTRYVRVGCAWATFYNWGSKILISEQGTRILTNVIEIKFKK